MLNICTILCCCFFCDSNILKNSFSQIKNIILLCKYYVIYPSDFFFQCMLPSDSEAEVPMFLHKTRWWKKAGTKINGTKPNFENLTMMWIFRNPFLDIYDSSYTVYCCEGFHVFHSALLCRQNGCSWWETRQQLRRKLLMLTFYHLLKNEPLIC